MSREEFLKHAWEWTDEFGGVILQQLKKLGCSCDWDRTKFTLDPDMYESVIKVFVDLLDVRSIEPSLLIETLDAIKNLDNIIKIFPFKYVHLGLNDLHIERSTHLIFEPYIDGLIDYVTGILRKNDQNFGGHGVLSSDQMAMRKKIDHHDGRSS